MSCSLKPARSSRVLVRSLLLTALLFGCGGELGDSVDGGASGDSRPIDDADGESDADSDADRDRDYDTGTDADTDDGGTAVDADVETSDPALDTSYYVAPAGSDDAPGTRELPWRSLATALGRLGPGDTLWVRGGDYNEIIRGVTYTPGLPASRVVVRSFPGERPIVRGMLQVIGADYWTFSGINVTRDPATSDEESTLLSLVDGTGWIYRDAEIWGAHDYAGVHVGGAPQDWRFIGNCVHDTISTHGADQDHNIYVNEGDRSGQGYIERNILFGAHNGTNIKFGSGAGQSAPDPRNVIVRHNTFHDARYNIRLVFESSNIDLSENIFSRATGAFPTAATQNIQGYCNRGAESSLYDNLGWDATAIIGYYHPASATASCPVVTGFVTLPAARNVSLDPMFDGVASCSQFHPGNGAARAYGRHAPVDAVLPGRWTSSATMLPGVISLSTVAVRLSNSEGPADELFTYGNAGDVYVRGDWDGDGVQTIGVFRGGTWFLRNSNSTGWADLSFAFGSEGDTPVVGDWDGDGVDTVGVFRSGTWFLRNSNSTGPEDLSFVFGSAVLEDRPIIGDWDGDGGDSIGVVRGNVLFLRDMNSAGPEDTTFSIGSAGDRFISGDWDGDGVDTIGVVGDGNIWHLRNSNTTGTADLSFHFDG